MRGKYSSKKLDYRSSNRVARNGYTLADWKRLYDRNPKAVPANVQRTLEQRGLIGRSR